MRAQSAFVIALAFVVPGTSSAQAQTERVFIGVNGTLQASDNSFRDGATFTENAEQGQFATDYEVKSGPALNIGGGVRVRKELSLGIGITRFSRTTAAEFSGSVPHPFFFSRPRGISSSIGGITRQEIAVHVQAVGHLPVGTRWQVAVFGGPSFFKLKQGLVTDFSYADQYPYDSASFASSDVTEVNESKVGFNVGTDVAFYFTQRLGVGGLVQFAKATIAAPSAGSGTVDVAVGGVQYGGGLRVRF